jgi:hypothetical protein
MIHKAIPDLLVTARECGKENVVWHCTEQVPEEADSCGKEG